MKILMEKQWNRILGLSKSETGYSVKRFIKLREGIAEFSEAFLEKNGFKVMDSTKTESELHEYVLEEGVGSLIMVLDILANQGYNLDDIRRMLDEKLDVWENVLVEKGLLNKSIDEPEEIKVKGNLIQNAVKCLVCGNIIVSNHRHDYQICGCPNKTMVDGGLDYGRYGGIDMNRIEYYHLYDNDDFEIIKNKLVWGTYGKEGNEPLKIIPLKECDTNHLNSILQNVSNINPIHRRVIRSILNDRDIS